VIIRALKQIIAKSLKAAKDLCWYLCLDIRGFPRERLGCEEVFENRCFLGHYILKDYSFIIIDIKFQIFKNIKLIFIKYYL
jgi:hypothetical protein